MRPAGPQPMVLNLFFCSTIFKITLDHELVLPVFIFSHFPIFTVKLQCLKTVVSIIKWPSLIENYENIARNRFGRDWLQTRFFKRISKVFTQKVNFILLDED